MTTAAPGITFSETMKGPFTEGEADPVSGAESASRSHLAMHATVTIRDLDRFIADPDHSGEISGSIDYEPLAMGIPTGQGVFRLFAPGNAPRTRYMVYELPFTHAGHDYYLAGRKEVRDDPGFDLWSDTTTLYTRLHRGTDTNAPVIGAGVLSLSAAEFAKVMASVRALDAASPTEAAALIARFGRFFAGQLWTTYVAPPAQ
jgi:cholesterol oxidase